MRYPISIPSQTNPYVTQGSPLYPARESSNPGHLWKAHRDVGEMLRQLRNNAATSNKAIANVNSFNQYASPWFHPFKIYRFPQQARLYFEDSDYRKLMVHTGNPFPSGPISYEGTNFSPFGYEYDFLGVQTVPPDTSTFANIWPPVTGELQPIDEGLPWHEVIVPDDGEVYYFWTSTAVNDATTGNPITGAGTAFVLFGTSVNNCLNLYDGTTVNDVSGGEVPDQNGLRLMIGQAQVQDMDGYKYLRTIQYRIGTDSGGGGGTGSIGLFQVQSVQKDYSTGWMWDTVNQKWDTSKSVYCLKDEKMRGSLASESIDGALISYDYSADTTSYLTRVATQASLGPPETQVWVPRLAVGNAIKVGSVPNGASAGVAFPVKDPAGNPITLIDITMRFWAKKAGTI